MNVTIIPTRLHGAITPPPSKSQAHRLIMAAALAEGESVISNAAFSQDILATLSCMEQLGAKWEKTEEDTIRIRGISAGTPRLREDGLPHFDCGESGSTLRFLIPVALAVTGGGVFTGHGRLMERPQEPYFELFDEKGIAHELKDGVLTVRGTMQPGEYAIRGDVSSQFFTGLLYALSLLDAPSTLSSTTKLESFDYVLMTIHALREASVPVSWKYEAEKVKMTVTAHPFTRIETAIENDWSQAAFWLAAAGIGNEVTVEGMNEESLQGDREILRWGEMIEGKPLENAVSVPVYGKAEGAKKEIKTEKREGCGVGIDVSRCPDLVPPAAAWGALMNGELQLKNAARLRIKESDRLAAVHQTLSALGAQIWEEEDRLIIKGVPALKGGVTVDSCNDHRIAMMAAIAATRCEQPVTILRAECVKKSYPNFWEDYEKLGGTITREESK